VRDYLETLDWNKQPPAPPLPDDVIAKTSEKYHEAYRASPARTCELARYRSDRRPRVLHVQSFRKGFSREIVGLAAAFAALVLGMWFYGLAGSFVAPYVGSQRAANLIGFLLVVFAVC
jgi:hypothetical protein